MKKIRKLVALVIAILLIRIVSFTFEFVKGVVPNDNDPELTKIAKSALPIIKQAVAYHDKNGYYPSPHELRDMVGDPRRGMEGDNILGNEILVMWHFCYFLPVHWNYNSIHNKEDFELICRFSLHQGLKYSYNGKQGEWSVFNDQTLEEKSVLLNP